VVHLPVAAVVMAALALTAALNLRPMPRPDAAAAASASAATADPSGSDPVSTATARRRSVITVQLLLLAVITLAMAFAEGAASDWLPLLMTSDHDAPEVLGSLVFTGFALAMLIGRSAGTPLVTRFGRATVIRTCAVVGAVGVVAVVLSPSPIVTAAAAVVWGLGIALGFPLAVSAAGDHPTDGDRRVSVVATAGYVAFLVGPPALGFLGEHLGLRVAMLVPLALLVVTVVIASAAGRQTSTPRTT
jgi:MFS family permease